LNVVQFGKSLFGVSSASQYYFQKSAAELTPLESAFLALLLPNPVKYSASFHNRRLTRFARGRILDILAKLQSVDRISDEEYLEAKNQLDQFPWKTEGDPNSNEIEPSDEGSEDEPSEGNPETTTFEETNLPPSGENL
jgi:monofunctional glycosyltransferase